MNAPSIVVKRRDLDAVDFESSRFDVDPHSRIAALRAHREGASVRLAFIGEGPSDATCTIVGIDGQLGAIGARNRAFIVAPLVKIRIRWTPYPIGGAT